METTAAGPRLAELAQACGVATSYWDQGGKHVTVGVPTIVAVLDALGLDASDDAAIERSLEQVRLRDWRRVIPPVFIAREGQERRLWVHVPHGAPARAWVELDDGSRRELTQLDHWVEPCEVDGVLLGEASFTVPGDLPLGWHTVVAEVPDVKGRTATHRSPLAMTPTRLDAPAITGTRQWGFMAQLYATRSSQSWGLGDLHDAATLASWSARDWGAGFVLLNPLHAAAPTPPMAPSPYLPVTRRFANPIYLHVEDVPELARLSRKDAKRVSELADTMHALNRSADYLDRDAVWAAKREALELVFDSGLTKERQADFDAYRAREGEGLRAFATWCAIADKHGPETKDWPKKLAHPGNPAVADFRMKKPNARAIDFHAWLQWQLDGQMRAIQAQAKDAGMAIGFMHDLAVGVHPEGADAWALQDVLARTVSVGAPPDMYNQIGQDWSQPPWRPDALAEVGFAPYRDMLRTVLRAAGGLRIDHVLGLFRQWWVPLGMPASHGTFVRFDHDAMLGILALEALQAGAVIVGEDLGTVEPWVQDALADRGILGTVILWFASGDDGGPLPPQQWRAEVLASATVHDLPPTAGYLRGEHVRIRGELDLLSRPIAEEAADADAERATWAALLVEHGWLAPDADLRVDAGLDAMAVALHAAVGASPARLVGIGLPDVVGDRRAQNQPGTDQEYPNWRVPMTDADGKPVLLDDIVADSAAVRRLVEAVTVARSRSAAEHSVGQ